jgi:hypothetical protein
MLKAAIVATGVVAGLTLLPRPQVEVAAPLPHLRCVSVRRPVYHPVIPHRVRRRRVREVRVPPSLRQVWRWAPLSKRVWQRGRRFGFFSWGRRRMRLTRRRTGSGLDTLIAQEVERAVYQLLAHQTEAKAST